MHQIAIADDRRDGIQRMLDQLRSNERFCIDIVAANGYELINQLQHVKGLPGVFITDINMPVIDGISLNFYLSVHYPSARIISISSYADEEAMLQAIESGAHGFIVKPEPETHLLAALDAVVNGEVYIDPRMNADRYRKVCGKSVSERRTLFEKYHLTMREATFVILNATALTYEQIARIMFVELKTVQTYFDRVAKKLGVHSRQSLTLFSLQHKLARLASYSI